MTELKIVEYLNHLSQGTFVDSITSFISLIPFLIVLWAIIAFTILFVNKQNGKWIFMAIIFALVLHFIISEGLLKHAILNFFNMRTRPYLAYPDLISPVGKLFIDSSFPSSHMASTLAVLTVLVYFYKKIWPAALFFVLLMAFARMHNGMHYPSDVLAGMILGLGYGILSIVIVNKISAKYSQRVKSIANS